MDSTEARKQFKALEDWIAGGDFYKVNGILGFTVDFYNPEKGVPEFIFSEDDGGEAKNEIAVRPTDIKSIEWDGSLDHCLITMKDGEEYTFTSYHYNQRGIPEKGE